MAAVYDKKTALSMLLSVAAELARGAYLPSDNEEDYEMKTMGRKRIAQMMERPHDESRLMAIILRECLDILAKDSKGG